MIFLLIGSLLISLGFYHAAPGRTFAVIEVGLGRCLQGIGLGVDLIVVPIASILYDSCSS